MADKKKFSVSNKIALLMLSVLALLLLLDVCTGLFLKNITNLTKILIYCVIFLLPLFSYIKLNKYKAKNILRLSHVKLRYLPFIVLFGLSVSIICALINAGSLAVFSQFMDIKIPTATVSFTSENPFVIGLTAVILPALCEEFLIRGAALSEYEKYGVPIAIIITSAVFSLFHGSLASFISLFVAGVCYAVLTYLFKSVWPAVLCHCINNALAVYLNYNAEYVKYLLSDILFLIIICAAAFVIIYLTLLLSEKVIDDLGDKNRLKTDRRKLVYGEPLGSAFIWIFFAVSIFNIVRNVLGW